MAVVIAYKMLKSALGLTALSCILLATWAYGPSDETYSGEEEVTLASLFKKCRSATGASKNAYNSFKLFKIPSSRDGRCFIKCVVGRVDQLPRKGKRLVRKYLKKTKFNRYFAKLRCPGIDDSRYHSDEIYPGGYDEYDGYAQHDLHGPRGHGTGQNSDYGDDNYLDDDYNEHAKKKPGKAGSPPKSGKAKQTGRSPK